MRRPREAQRLRKTQHTPRATSPSSSLASSLAALRAPVVSGMVCATTCACWRLVLASPLAPSPPSFFGDTFDQVGAPRPPGCINGPRLCLCLVRTCRMAFRYCPRECSCHPRAIVVRRSLAFVLWGVSCCGAKMLALALYSDPSHPLPLPPPVWPLILLATSGEPIHQVTAVAFAWYIEEGGSADGGGNCIRTPGGIFVGSWARHVSRSPG